MSSPALLFLGLGCLALGVVIPIALWRAPAGTTGVARSLAALERTTILRSGNAAAAHDEGGTASLLARLGDLSRLAPSGYRASIQLLLDKAGNPRDWSLQRLFAVKLLGSFMAALLGALLGAHSPAKLLSFFVLGALAGFFVPDLLIYNTGLKRQEQMQKALPDALDMLTVSVEAGLGFDAALAQVARNTEGPVAAEFVRVLQEMQIGKSRTDALRGLGERTTVMDMRTFASAIVQADTLGIPIANVLREQAREMRIKRHQRAEEKAQKVTVKIMFPVVLCILPSLFVIVIGPGAIGIAHVFMHKAS
jgi:tight adherence protein C